MDSWKEERKKKRRHPPFKEENDKQNYKDNLVNIPSRVILNWAK